MRQSQQTNDSSVNQRQPSPATPLHQCMMPFDYFAPRGFVKMIRPGIERSLGRKKAVDLFMRFQSQARVICGRCESSCTLTIWTAADVRRYIKTVSSFDIDAVIQRDYRAFVFRCPVCGHEAHLAETGADGFLDDWDVG